MKIILIVLGILMVYIIQKLLFERLWNKELETRIFFGDLSVTEGETTLLTEIVSNRKWLLLPALKVMFKVEKGLEFEDNQNIKVTDLCYKFDIFSILPYQKIERIHKVTCERRGMYEIKEIDLSTSDLCFSGEYYSSRKNAASLYVFPGRIDIERIQIPFERVMGEILARKYLQEDPFEFAGIREYQSYDSMRSINWKTSARTGQYMVNIHEATSSQEIYFLFNADQDNLWHHDDLLEEGMRILRTLAEQFLGSGITVRFLTNARDKVTHESLSLLPGSGSSHGSMLNEMLARIDLSLEAERFGAYLEELTLIRQENVLYIMISTSCREELQDSFHKLQQNSPGSVWISPIYKENEEKPKAGSVKDILYWEYEKSR